MEPGRTQDLRTLIRLFSFALEAIQVAHWAPLWAPTFSRGFVCFMAWPLEVIFPQLIAARG